MISIDQPTRRAMNEIECGHDQGGVKQDRFQDMTQYVLSHLVSHDKEQFRLIKLGDNRIPEDDPSGLPEPGDIGINSVRILTLVYLIDAAALDPGAIGQSQNCCLELLVLHRPEFIEERLNP